MWFRSLLIGGLCVLLSSCAAADDAPVDDSLGSFTFALSGTLPGVQAFKLSIYQGPLTSSKQSARFALSCAPYLVSATENRNAFTLRDMPAGKNYSVLVEFFEDTACTKAKLRAYRGGVEVVGGSSDAAAETPYYMQPVRIGGFTGMAEANDALVAEAGQRSCSTDQDCAAVHPAATCTAGKNRCNVNSLFPLNGGAVRAFPSLVALASGTIALAGGFSVVDVSTGVWSATTSKVEQFDPSLGRFIAPASSVDNFDAAGRVGMASSAPLGGSTFAMVGGTKKAQVKLAGSALTTTLQDATCAGGGASCPASKSVWRVDLPSRLSSGTQLPQPLALPIVARVATPGGPRLLVAGGADQPIPKSGSSRSGEARLCELSGTAAECAQSDSKLNVARAHAAVGCIKEGDDGCKTLLIIGGRINKNAAMVEQYDAESDAFKVLPVTGAPPYIFGGHLVRAGASLFLVGASSAALFLEGRNTKTSAGVVPYKIVVDDSGAERRIRFEKVGLGSFGGADGGRRVLAAAVGLSSGHALLIGGIGADSKVADSALLFDETGVIARLPLDKRRFAAAAVEIPGTSPFGGCALLAGGADIGKTGTGLSHVEIYCPPDP
ncbi:MAG: hypothetical protein KC502_01565 [Myxococcales bacterium]|nr:hypothetical protein [Myxococcales bacterium]